MSLDNMNMAFVVINYCIDSWFIQDKVNLTLSTGEMQSLYVNAHITLR